MEISTLVPGAEPRWLILLGMILVAVGGITRMRMTKRRPE
jgi:hypothetical protein